jgi:hypothetical protein
LIQLHEILSVFNGLAVEEEFALAAEEGLELFFADFVSDGDFFG